MLRLTFKLPRSSQAKYLQRTLSIQRKQESKRISLKRTLKVPTEKLIEEPYASVLTYPKLRNAELEKRLRELQKLGVSALEFGGEKQVSNLPVLGKGCVGIVTIAYVSGRKTALKIRRVDADRSRMEHEAEMLEKANSVSVGPRLLKASKNFLLMEFVDGELLPKWLEKKETKAQVRRVIRDILQQCWRLDKIGLDHGELSHAPKHIIIDKDGNPFIVDFETASVNRRPSNVTSICQFLFMSGVAEKLADKIGERDKKVILEALKRYKGCRNQANFERVLKSCGL